MEAKQAIELSGAQDWRPEDEAESTAPRIALGTLELVPLVRSEAVHRDLSHAEVAQIVHDLKGPLATIDLELEMLADGGVATASIDRITRNVAFLDRMVMDLLDRCTLDAGRLVLRRIPTDVRASLECVIDRIVPTRDRGRVFLFARARTIVDIDDLRIERVVANLLDNALRYAPASSEIVIALERNARSIRISVSDAGHGIAAADLASVFDEYSPRSPSSSRKGTGIGLFLSKQIIEAHGGTIGVESSPGAGTRFYFDLPAIA